MGRAVWLAVGIEAAPRVSSWRPWVLARFDAVIEMPLKRIKKEIEERPEGFSTLLIGDREEHPVSVFQLPLPHWTME